MPPSIKNEFTRNPISSIAAIVATFCALGTLLTGVVLAAQWTEEIEGRLSIRELADHKHSNDRTLHQPYKEKVEEWVRQVEYREDRVAQQRVNDEIKRLLIEQDSKNDRMLNILLERR